MESGFDYRLKADECLWIQINLYNSSRYKFFKARINGRLQFIKTPADKYTSDLLTIEALRKEFAIAYPLDHPSIVRYYDFKDNVIFQEFIDGVSLHQMIQDGDKRLKSKEFLTKVCRQILQAIDYLHTHGILHLDIKPENILITRIGSNVKIVDFGCAYSATCDSTPGHTARYKAPEQGVAESNCFTDIFLVGKVMEELTRYAGETNRWRRFILKATSDNPSDRFQSAADALKFISARSISRRLTIAILTFTCIFLILGYFTISRYHADDTPVANLSHAHVLDNDGSDLAMTAATTSDSVSSAEQAPLPSNIDTEPAPIDITPQIMRKIDRYIIDYYAANVHPVAADTTLDDNHELTLLHEDSLQRAMAKAIQAAINYGNKLAGQYPDKKALIDNRVMETVNSQQTIASITLYGLPSEPDSLYIE